MMLRWLMLAFICGCWCSASKKIVGSAAKLRQNIIKNLYAIKKAAQGTGRL
jgi:hypothetical protein